MARLCVNIDHVATVRQARRTYEPSPIAAAHEAMAGGAHGITVHLREDRRHIQDADVVAIADAFPGLLNFEMAATDEMVAMALRIRPVMAMLVPEGRHEVTTEGGLDVLAQEQRVREVIAKLNAGGVRASIFIDAVPAQIEAARRCGAAVCEVHTGPWAHAVHDHGDDCRSAAAMIELGKVRLAGETIQSLGMQFNAGHALNYLNVGPVAALPGLGELHIGHAIISSAVFLGLRAAVARMRSCIDSAALTVH
ncbi:MAG: pyridoxine 5'-phosphate synthase [Planctomycetota bacterium]|nr:MAG: pyridoxine 5'-phosphate synthase [Planctomycetota bacterium]